MGASAKSPLCFPFPPEPRPCVHAMQYGIITVVLVGLTIYRAFFNAETTLWQVGVSTVWCPFTKELRRWMDDGSPRLSFPLAWWGCALFQTRRMAPVDALLTEGGDPEDGGDEGDLGFDGPLASRPSSFSLVRLSTLESILTMLTPSVVLGWSRLVCDRHTREPCCALWRVNLDGISVAGSPGGAANWVPCACCSSTSGTGCWALP
jgi:hypothetical protein